LPITERRKPRNIESTQRAKTNPRRPHRVAPVRGNGDLRFRKGEKLVSPVESDSKGTGTGSFGSNGGVPRREKGGDGLERARRRQVIKKKGKRRPFPGTKRKKNRREH